jgi:hypothetical protein
MTFRQKLTSVPQAEPDGMRASALLHFCSYKLESWNPRTLFFDFSACGFDEWGAFFL